MKRKGSPGEGPRDTGPFRMMEQSAIEEGNLPYNEAIAIKKMKDKIEAEKKFSIRLAEKIEQNNTVPLFAQAIENNVDPKDIVFYSLATGILEYQFHDTNPIGKEVFYNYHDPKNLEVRISIELSKKENSPATILRLTTKADVKKKAAEVQKQEQSQKAVQEIKNVAETGTHEELEELRIDLERILFIIKDRLNKKKPRPNTIK